MKHITFADKSLMVGSTTADLLLQYAAQLANTSSADTVLVNAISSDGDEVEATFLLDAGAPIMAETTNSSQPEPDNHAADRYMLARLEPLSVERQYPASQADDDPAARSVLDEFEV